MDHPDTGFTVVRGTFECPWCDAAIDLLTEKGLPFTVQKLGMADLILRQAELHHTTVPMVFHGVKFIGGFEATKKYLEG